MTKSVKKAVKRTAAANEKSAENRDKIIKMLLRKNGATLREMIDAGRDQPAATALKMAANHGLKVWSKKEEGDVTHYFASGTPTEPTRKPAKKAVKKVAKKAKKAAAKRTAKKAPTATATVTNGGATA